MQEGAVERLKPPKPASNRTGPKSDPNDVMSVTRHTVVSMMTLIRRLTCLSTDKLLLLHVKALRGGDVAVGTSGSVWDTHHVVRIKGTVLAPVISWVIDSKRRPFGPYMADADGRV